MLNVDLIFDLYSKPDLQCSPGGYELTDMDVLKLQKAYGCNGTCGGWAKSETGGLCVCIYLCNRVSACRGSVKLET